MADTEAPTPKLGGPWAGAGLTCAVTVDTVGMGLKGVVTDGVVGEGIRGLVRTYTEAVGLKGVVTMEAVGVGLKGEVITDMVGVGLRGVVREGVFVSVLMVTVVTASEVISGPVDSGGGDVGVFLVT